LRTLPRQKFFSSHGKRVSTKWAFSPTEKSQLPLYQAWHSRCLPPSCGAVAGFAWTSDAPKQIEVEQMTKQTNILLIDEDLMVRQALEQALAVENYYVLSAANRNEALREV